MSTPYSYVIYTGDGSTSTYTIPFEYVQQADVNVTVNDVPQSFTFPTASQVTLTTAPDAGSVVKVYRDTAIADPTITFTDGAPLVQNDLNTAFEQVLDSVQELTDTQNFWIQFIQENSTGAGGGGGTSLPVVGPINNGSILVAFNSQWNIYSTLDARSLFGIPAAGCGTAAASNIGTGSGEIPTANLLGAAAWKSVGTSAGDLVLYDSFHTGAFTTVGTGVGQIPAMIDLGGGTPGYPGISGQAITNVVHDIAYIRLEYNTAYNVNGGAYTTHPNFSNVALNWIVWDDTGAVSLSSSKFTLPIGTYDYRGRVFMQGIGPATVRLVKSDGTPIYPNNPNGPVSVSASGSADADYAEVSGRFGIATPTDCYLQIAGTTNNSGTAAFGNAHGQSAWGGNTFAILEFWKYQ